MKEIIEKIDNTIAYWKTDVHEFQWGKKISKEELEKIISDLKRRINYLEDKVGIERSLDGL